MRGVSATLLGTGFTKAPAATPWAVTLPAGPCGQTGCAGLDLLSCSYKDRRQRRCAEKVCPEHASVIHGYRVCERHAGVMRALNIGFDELGSLPDLENRAPASVDVVARALDAGITEILGAALAAPGEVVVSDATVRAAPCRGQTRVWERSWKVLDHTGIAVAVVADSTDDNDTLVSIRVGRHVVARGTPPVLNGGTAEAMSAFVASCLSQIASVVQVYRTDTHGPLHVAAPVPFDEPARMRSLRQSGLLDTESDQLFDSLAWLAASLCGTPVAAVSLIDDERQWFKARIGLPVEVPRSISLCAHTLTDPSTPLVIPDASLDERFAGNPIVAGPVHVRFYASVPIRGIDGQPLGALCVGDTEPGNLTPEQLEGLQRLAGIAEMDMVRRMRSASQAAA